MLEHASPTEENTFGLGLFAWQALRHKGELTKGTWVGFFHRLQAPPEVAAANVAFGSPSSTVSLLSSFRWVLRTRRESVCFSGMLPRRARGEA